MQRIAGLIGEIKEYDIHNKCGLRDIVGRTDYHSVCATRLDEVGLDQTVPSENKCIRLEAYAQ